MNRRVTRIPVRYNDYELPKVAGSKANISDFMTNTSQNMDTSIMDNQNTDIEDTIPKHLATNEIDALKKEIDQLKSQQTVNHSELLDKLQQVTSECKQKDQEIKTMKDELMNLSSMYDENLIKMRKMTAELST